VPSQHSATTPGLQPNENASQHGASQQDASQHSAGPGASHKSHQSMEEEHDEEEDEEEEEEEDEEGEEEDDEGEEEDDEGEEEDGEEEHEEGERVPSFASVDFMHPYSTKDKDFVNAKAFLMKASTLTGLNL